MTAGALSFLFGVGSWTSFDDLTPQMLVDVESMSEQASLEVLAIFCLCPMKEMNLVKPTFPDGTCGLPKIQGLFLKFTF